MPKTLIFAKSDSHADDIINIAREEFAEENKFCKKITYKADDPKGVLQNFRNEYYPRIAVTVDIIATGTDVKPLECLLFMRDVKSRNYFEQMKGRGTRTILLDDLRKVTPSAHFTKDHFVIVDAIGATKSIKTDSRPLEKTGIPLKDLLGAVAVGVRDEELFTSLANRLTRLDKQVTENEKRIFVQKTGGKTIGEVAKSLLSAYDPDRLEDIKLSIEVANPDAAPADISALLTQRHSLILEEAAAVFTGELNTYIDNVRKAHEQIIDDINQDALLNVGWDTDVATRSGALIKDFTEWLINHKEEIVALKIFYDQPYKRREITYGMIKNLVEQLKLDKPVLAPLHIWKAYEQLEKVNGSTKNELIALVSLIRKVSGMDTTLTSFDKTVDKNFQDWIFKKQAGTTKYTTEQVQWLRMIKDYIANSFHVDRDDFELDPFNKAGGLGKFYQLFKEDYEKILEEMNEQLIA